jgi:16S rRNA (guanine1207-N2)-methyltransferase
MPGDRAASSGPVEELYAVELHGRRFLAALPDTGAADPAATLLAGAVAVEPGATVLDLNCGAGLVGAVAAALASPGRAILAADSILDLAAAERTIAANASPNADVHLSNGTGQLALAAPVDLASVRLPKGTLPARQLIWDAFRALRVGGRLYLAGGSDEGIRPAARQAEALFGNLTTLAYRRGHRVGVAIKPAAPPPLPPAFAEPLLDHAVYHQFAVTLRGATYQVRSRPGVFAWERLDAGSAALIDAMRILPGEHVLDLGCGCGVVGAVAARLAGAGRATLVDIAADALDAARQTLLANDIDNAEVIASDGAAAVRERRFDVVVANPPFHPRQGRTTAFEAAARFIDDAATVLRPGGRLYLVANRFIPYEDAIRRAFGAVAHAWADSRYKVLTATRAGD